MSDLEKKSKSITFTDYDVLGFDMDFTLARYKLVPFYKMVYRGVCKYLVEERNYEPSIFHELDQDKDLIYKGLLVDFEKGNVLKLDKQGSILRATHGTRKLTTAQLEEAYGREKKFSHFQTFMQGMKCLAGRWRFFENYFDIPALVAFARIIDSINDKKTVVTEDKKTFLHIWTDVYDALGDMYTPQQFKANQGNFFPNMKADVGAYIDLVSPAIKQWLTALRQDNRKIFLLTSSFPDFATHIMEYSFGPDWRSYFDLVVFGGRKPRFFTEVEPFMEVENLEIGQETKYLQEGGEYCHGNHLQLMTFFKKITGKTYPKVVYFGDNLWADAWPSKTYGQWDTVLVLEEMDAEGYAVSDGTVTEQEGAFTKGFKHSSLVTAQEIQLMVSDFWGSVFIDNLKDNQVLEEKQMNTAFGSLISTYADVCVPSIEYLAGEPLVNVCRLSAWQVLGNICRLSAW
ncbi:5'-nucleotidase domain-containing protein 1-like isoform X2 [Physella acuta]|uniref:5'-nucleotidase domain-containing protein 1-like isoform X2 n=1 Tax=Physella acuta TaxID=109671 RepID=UPI0027DAC14F|nr:5'-nucleotidase domain-containing protein 1-like isoform X2 [Physella acuta]